MIWARCDAQARAQGLALRAVAPLRDEDGYGHGQAVLLGPDEPGFWPRFQASDEALDAQPNPLDRWSKRVIGGLAERWGGRAVFPSDPPYPPFIDWALRSGQVWQSPVGLLVHGETGLFLSFRGAVLVVAAVEDVPEADTPCAACADKPCLTACPVGALGAAQSYDVPRCKVHLRGDGKDCWHGCLVRRACPVSQGFGRDPAQSAFHMRAFMAE